VSKKPPALTPKQLKFAHYVAEGVTASEAYRRVYASAPGKPPVRVAEEASDVRHNPRVAAYIDELRAEAKSRAVLTRADVLAKLDAMISDPDVSETAPQEVNVFGLGDLLAVVRKGSKR
jgi:hypothetical protein